MSICQQNVHVCQTDHYHLSTMRRTRRIDNVEHTIQKSIRRATPARLSRVYKPPRYPSRDSFSRKPSDRRRSCSRCRQSCDTVSDKIHLTNVSAIIEADLWRKRIKLPILSIRRKESKGRKLFSFAEKKTDSGDYISDNHISFFLCRINVCRFNKTIL